MKTTTRTFQYRFLLFLTLSTFILVGCSRGFDRAGMRQTLERGSVATIRDKESSLTDILALKPQLPKGAKLAVYFDNEYFWRGAEDEKKSILAGLEDAIRGTPFSEIIPVRDFEDRGVPAAVDDKSPMYAQRKIAARYSADAVLVIRGLADDDRYANPLVALDIATLSLTGLFLPSQHIDVLSLITASLWDVRNGYLYCSAEAEGLDSSTFPLYWSGSQQHSTEEASRREAVTQLLPELKRRLATIRR